MWQKSLWVSYGAVSSIVQSGICCTAFFTANIFMWNFLSSSVRWGSGNMTALYDSQWSPKSSLSVTGTQTSGRILLIQTFFLIFLCSSIKPNYCLLGHIHFNDNSNIVLVLLEHLKWSIYCSYRIYHGDSVYCIHFDHFFLINFCIN